jgi:hypothetical protein
METALIIYTQDGNVPYVADLYENETIALQYSFNDIKDLKPSGTYSRTFRIPATNNNAQIFGFIEQNTFQFSNFNPKRKLNAIITVDTLPVMEGSIQFKAAYTSNGVVSEYEIVFFGNVIDFFKNIGDADFKNYIGAQLQNDYSFVVNYTNVTDVIAETIGDGNLQFTLTDRGNNWVGSSNSDNTRSIYAYPTYNYNNPSQWQDQIDQIIKIGELTLMVKARYIFDKIIELSGFSVDDVASDTLLDELNRLFVVWTSEANITQQVGNPEAAKFVLRDGIDNITFDGTDFTPITLATGTVLYHYPIPNLTEVNDPNNYVVNNVFTVPFNGYYKVKCAFNVEQNADGLGGFQLGFLIQDLNGDYRLSTVQPTGTYFANWTSGTTFPQEQNINCGIGNDFDTAIYLNAGETIQPIFWEINPNPINVTLTLRDASAQGEYPFVLNSSFFCDYASKPLMGNDIDYSANAPVMKCTEFMSSIFKMFNLVVVPDAFNPKLLSFIPIQEYLASGTQKDWSNILDISKDIVLTSTSDYQATLNRWTYKESTDYLNNIYNTQGNRIYGRLELLDPENDFATQQQEIKLEFGSTPLALIQGTEYPIPKFINAQAEYVTPTPRILRFTDNPIFVNIWDEESGAVVTDYLISMFSHYSQLIPTLDSFDFNFGQESPLHPVTAIPYQTLYQRFWNDYIANIYAPDARIMEAFFALEFADIYNFKYNDQIFIKDSYWRILEISDYVVGMEESVKVKLMKLISVEPDCLLTPSAIDANGEVIFYDSEGNPASSTEICCTNYGYTWDGISKCFAFQRDSDGQTKSLTNDKVQLTRDVTINTDKLLQLPNNSVDFNNMHSIVGGMNNFLGANNDGSLVNGNRNFISADLGSVNVMGSNATVINKGLTIGGNGNYSGEIQTGIVHAWGNGNFTNNTTYIDLKIEGADNYNIPTNTNWILKILLSGMQYGLSGMDGIITGEYNIHVVNRNTTVLFINATTIDETFDNLTGYLVWDLVISGETFYPRVKLVGSSTYSENDIKLSALTTFTQYHYE